MFPWKNSKKSLIILTKSGVSYIKILYFLTNCRKTMIVFPSSLFVLVQLFSCWMLRNIKSFRVFYFLFFICKLKNVGYSVYKSGLACFSRSSTDRLTSIVTWKYRNDIIYGRSLNELIYKNEFVIVHVSIWAKIFSFSTHSVSILHYHYKLWGKFLNETSL